MTGIEAPLAHEGVRPIPRARGSAIRLTFELMRSPDRFFERLSETYGPAVAVRLLGFGDTVWISDAEAVKDAYTNAAGLRQGGASTPVLEPLLGENSLLTLAGERHLRQRRLLLPPFHGTAVRAYQEAFERLTATEVERWRAGERFRLRPRMQRLTMDAILATVLGVEDPVERRDLRDATTRFISLMWMAALGDGFRRDLGPLSPWGTFLRRREALDELLYAHISRRRRAGAATDVLSLLIRARDEDGRAMTDRELRDELITLLLAGHDTTANALAWCFDLVLRDPAVEARLIEEAVTGGSAYADAVITETLRLRPTVPFTGRIAGGGTVLRGYRIPAGARVWQPALLLQRDPEVFPEPLRFRPERWLDAKPPAYQWIPFGGGIRRCIGAAFAALEMRVVLQQIIVRARLERLDRRPERPGLNNVILVPRRGVRVRVAALS